MSLAALLNVGGGVHELLGEDEGRRGRVLTREKRLEMSCLDPTAWTVAHR
jgi:hypothetical protein